MKKSELIKEIDDIIAKNNRLFTKCRELENTVAEREADIERLNAEIEKLKSENLNLKTTAAETAEAVEAVGTAETTEIVETLEEAVSEADESCVQENVVEDNAETCENEVFEDFSADSDAEALTESEISTTEDTAEVADSFEPMLREEVLSSASESIGRVVLKCAEVCNAFAAAGNQNSKDLINLALGRTEVFKSDVLALVSSEDMSSERLKAELNLREAAVNEYFELLLRQ